MSTGLIEIMKRASLEANESTQPCDLRTGTVVSASPLQVKISSQLTLPQALLIVPQHLTDYEVPITITSGFSSGTHSQYSGDGSHSHTITKGSGIIHNALKVGDKVALLRKQGGQSYFILDRI